MKRPLPTREQENLRIRSILRDCEIAYRDGNLFFAEDAISGEKRTINISSYINESKGLLLG